MTPTSRPNILLLYTDQQRHDTLGAGGNPLIHTPNLDRLAAAGALFRHAYVNCPVCQPSRMSMLSGQYPASTRIASNGIAMPEHIPTIPTVLQRYGYHTANLGKLHFWNHSDRDHRDLHPAYGFDTLVLADEPGCYDDAYIAWVRDQAPDQVAHCRCDTPPAWTGPQVSHHPRSTEDPYVFRGPEHLTHTAFVAHQTADFIRRHASGDPWFAIAGFYAPHCPINPPQRFVDLYDPAAMPLPQRLPGQNYRDVSDDLWRQTTAYYYALISHIDDQIGHILQTLADTGQEENTLVIFTSDHGENLGDHGLIGKGNPHDSSARVPLLLRHPARIPAGQVHDHIVEHVDLAPTILETAVVQTPPYMQGQSLAPLLRGHAYTPRDAAFGEHRNPFGQAWKSLRSADYLYVRDQHQREQLYHHPSDPHQLTDRAADPAHAAALHDMRHRLLARWFQAESQYPVKTAQY